MLFMKICSSFHNTVVTFTTGRLEARDYTIVFSHEVIGKAFFIIFCVFR